MRAFPLLLLLLLPAIPLASAGTGGQAMMAMVTCLRLNPGVECADPITDCLAEPPGLVGCATGCSTTDPYALVECIVDSDLCYGSDVTGHITERLMGCARREYEVLKTLVPILP